MAEVKHHTDFQKSKKFPAVDVPDVVTHNSKQITSGGCTHKQRQFCQTFISEQKHDFPTTNVAR